MKFITIKYVGDMPDRTGERVLPGIGVWEVAAPGYLRNLALMLLPVYAGASIPMRPRHTSPSLSSDTDEGLRFLLKVIDYS